MTLQINHRPEAGRIEANVENNLCYIEYRLDSTVMHVLHTIVPAAVGGRGIAGKLTDYALDLARENGWKINPVCSYTAAYFKRHPEHRDLSAA
ncbi:GNAT family N-acetyltransferase [Advenella sp. S44]|uniref:GNAT family N-acetyltransferase n=1 Tax=Advenella sp. S44 TaxID=1982755 RepID=UPI000C29B8C7|nr:GNAT family N-acetyltransferase [Advenella sp. S44]PJX22184.1 GNAT family N-acetyltransferase [Advenella sp. S44]